MTKVTGSKSMRTGLKTDGRFMTKLHTSLNGKDYRLSCVSPYPPVARTLGTMFWLFLNVLGELQNYYSLLG